MTFFSPGALWFLLLVPILILMYILKQRFQEREVSSLYLWHQVIMDTEANSPFQKLRNNILFFLQLLILLLVILALTNPFLLWKNKDYRNVVMVIDTTGSMSALGEDEIKLTEAKKRAEAMVNSLPSGSKITLISSGRNSKVETSSSSDKKEVINKIKAIEKTNSAGSIEDTYSLVKAICSQYESYKVTYFTDKAVDLKDLNGEVIDFSVPRSNVSLDYIAHSKGENGLRVMLRATNRGTEKTKAEICLYGEEELISLQEIDLAKGETKTVYFDNVPVNKRYIMGEISQEDALKEDNIIYDIVKQKDSSRVLLVTEKNVFLEKVLTAIKDIDLYKTNPGEEIKEDFDLYIFDNAAAKTIPQKGSILFINPVEDNILFKVGSEKNGGKAEVVSHGITKYMENSDFVIAKSREITVPYWGSSLMRIDGKDIAFTGEYKGQRAAAVGFDFHNTDLPLTPEFPIFINNLISYLIDRDTLSNTKYSCGDSIEIIPLPEAERIYVTDPQEKKLQLSSKYPVKPYENTYTPGVYEFSQKVGEKDISKLIAVNFPVSESDILSDGSQSSNAKAMKLSKGGINLKNSLITAVLIFLIIEWLVYIRLNGNR